MEFAFTDIYIKIAVIFQAIPFHFYLQFYLWVMSKIFQEQKNFQRPLKILHFLTNPSEKDPCLLMKYFVLPGVRPISM